MTLQELLDLGQPIFSQIGDAVSRGNYHEAYRLLDSPQPAEWIKTMPSEATEGVYYHNDIELIEGICERVFERWWYEVVGQPTLTTTKSGVIITVTVKTTVGFDTDDIYRIQSGVASEYVSNPKYIPLATPKAASLAYKNAMKKYGRLFGKDLNRGIENAPIEATEVVNVATLADLDALNKCDTIEKLSALKKDLPPALMSAYMTKLKELTKQIKP